jgi:hypothetical protein
MKKFLEELIKGSAHILYHVVVVSLSAAIALSLPYTAAFVTQNLQVYWLLIETQKVFLISIEIGLAVLLILFFNFIARIWKDKKLSSMAKAAGLVFVTPNKGFFARRRIRKLKTKQGYARDIMFIGSTGYRTFVDPNGELYHAVQNCREAKIMLLCPYSKGATTRAKGILSPDITPACLGAQIQKSIDYLKGLKGIQKNIKLKLYHDPPFLKVTILADYAWVQHYHAGIDVEMMPKYVFKHNQNPKSLYVPFYEYFLARWDNPDIPEYDFDSDELIYRDLAGNEVKREKPEWIGMEFPPVESPYDHPNSQLLPLREPSAGSL